MTGSASARSRRIRSMEFFYFKPQLLRVSQRGGIVQQRLKFFRVKAARFRFFIQECVEKILFHIEKEQLAAHA